MAEEDTFKILNEPHCLFTKDAIFLMEQFTNGCHLTPSEFANQIDLFFTKISRHFIFSRVNKNTINNFFFMYFSYETLQRACHYPTSFEYSFQKCLSIIKKVLSILSKPWPKIDFRHDIWNELIQSCENFNTNFDEFSRINRIELRQLWWYLQTEIKSQINHPDYVYDAIVNNLQELNKLLEFILYNQFGANNQNELLSLFELEWKNNKWYSCAVEECYRLIWFHYLKYNRPPKISLPISDDSAKQLLFSLSIKNTSQIEIYQKKLADIIAFLNQSLIFLYYLKAHYIYRNLPPIHRIGITYLIKQFI